ncbi:major facilitator superfamily domain-containing protein [Cyathus striatus]|nr:major facilitator superfamily domain-containing protein [Cyathus striatus]
MTQHCSNSPPRALPPLAQHPVAFSSQDMAYNITRGSAYAQKQTSHETINVIMSKTLKSSEEADFPDGGLRAWLIVCGVYIYDFLPRFGFVNAWGVFQSYYETNVLQDSSPSQIAWIGSVQYSLVFFPGQISGRFFDLGYFRIPFFIGSVILVVATFLVAHCTKYWHFLLCQGFAIGISCGICFGPTLGIVGHWFKKKRGFALGLTAVGSSIGGTVFPIAARLLIDRVGFPWTMRIMAFMIMTTLGVSNLTLARRLPPQNVPGGIFNLKMFKMPAFSIYCVANFVAFLGIYTVLTYVDVGAIKIGISPDFSFYLVSMANAGSGVGRLITGLLVDRVGPVNVIMPMTLATSIMTFAWPYALTKESLIVVAIIYGYTSSAYVSAFHMPLYEMGQIEDVGRRVGTVMTFAALGALAGPPISGAINRATGGFNAVSYYAGSTTLLAIVLMLVTRHLVIRRLSGKF